MANSNLLLRYFIMINMFKRKCNKELQMIGQWGLLCKPIRVADLL